jgi:hypothetical protein
MVDGQLTSSSRDKFYIYGWCTWLIEGHIEFYVYCV